MNSDFKYGKDHLLRLLPEKNITEEVSKATHVVIAKWNTEKCLPEVFRRVPEKGIIMRLPIRLL